MLFLGLNNILNFYFINRKIYLKKKKKRKKKKKYRTQFRIEQANLVIKKKKKKIYIASKGLGGRAVPIFETEAIYVFSHYHYRNWAYLVEGSGNNCLNRQKIKRKTHTQKQCFRTKKKKNTILSEKSLSEN